LGCKCPFKVPNQFAVGTAQVPSGTPCYWHSLTIVGYMGSFNVSLNQFSITSNVKPSSGTWQNPSFEKGSLCKDSDSSVYLRPILNFTPGGKL
jgi:hypothetical protein